MRKLLLSVVALFAMSAQNAFAINLTFQFDVNSSGPSIYACNAGIKHGKKQGNQCYDRRDATRTCTAGCAAGNVAACINDVKPVDCVCTGEFDPTGNQGTYRMDFLQATTYDWADNQEKMDESTKKVHTKTADGKVVGNNVVFNQLFGADEGKQNFTVNAAYEKQIKDMSINLGSELYGAEYFVDICYRGPQIDYKQENGTVDGLNFNLIAKATSFDIKKGVTGVTDPNYVRYATLAGLKVKAEARCILDDNFDYCLADVLPGNNTACGQNDPTYYEHLGDGEKDLGLNTNVANLIHANSIENGKNRTPRFCQIRYTFRETKTTEMRKWKLQNARICTYTEISEPGKK